LDWRIVSPLVVLGWVVLLAVLERCCPYDPRQRFLRRGFWTDLVGYTILQSLVLGLLIGELIRWMDSTTGLSRLGLVSDWPVWLQVTFFVVTHDLYIYWFHRAQHAHPVLWRLHEAHHSNTNIDWLAGLRSHSLEILINQTIEFAPMVLLGAAPVVPVLKSMISAV
jgi:sterol desaturase/sphingolipid hydroxylase (fatty acid hydroxylase superfamily)